MGTYKLSEKEKKKFNNLSKRDKMKVSEAMLTQAINNSFGRKIAESIISGGNLMDKTLYEKYVKEIDGLAEGSEERNILIEKLLSSIRVSHIGDNTNQ